MGKPLCIRCRAEVEEESRNRYRKGIAKEHFESNRYSLDVYRP